MEKKRAEKCLPVEMSDMLELAVNDVQIVEQDPKYKLEMGEWHTPSDLLGVCHVCMAGAIIANTLKCSKNHEIDPWTFDDDETSELLLAVNAMRLGDFQEAAKYLHRHIPEEVAAKAKACLTKRSDTLSYDTYIWKNYLKAAKVLRANGY